MTIDMAREARTRSGDHARMPEPKSARPLSGNIRNRFR